LLLVFGGLVWWLLFSPLSRDGRAPSVAASSTQSGRVLGGLVLVSGALFTFGTRWDELWHRLYGGFGNDFLWPPHLMIYGALGLNAFFAAFGLVRAGQGSGGLRERFRAKPLVGLLGLVALYQLASIPSDLTWHRIIGPDISAWSLPHFLLEFTSSAVLLIGLALLLSARSRPSWGSGGPIDLTTLVVLGLLLVSTLSLLQFGVTEWEWRVRDEWPFERAAWVYPVVVLVIGAAEAHLALHALRRAGSATALALLALLVQAAFVADARAVLPPGPWLVSHLLLVAPAVALDLWYAAHLARAGAGSTLLGGALLYAAVYFAVALPLIGRLMPYPAFDPATLLPTVALGTVATLLVSFLASVVVGWLATAGALAPRMRPVHAASLVASAG
jgi:hypothetical protein